MDYFKEKLSKLDEATLINTIVETASETPVNDEIVHIKNLKKEILEEYNRWGKPKGLSTGFPSLDEKIGGMGAGHVILIGGDSGMGKSALASNIAVNVSKTKPVLVITLEMLAVELGVRIRHINNKDNIDDLNLFFQSEHRLNYSDLKPLLKRGIEECKMELVVLDYLQYLGRGMTEREVAKISKEIKTLSLEFNIPFIVITSLRKSEGGKNKRKWTDIELEDLMGTAAIGYDCDVAIIASRKDTDDEWDDEHLYVKVLKTRNAKLNFKDRFIKFNWDDTRITEGWVDEALQVFENA